MLLNVVFTALLMVTEAESFIFKFVILKLAVESKFTVAEEVTMRFVILIKFEPVKLKPVEF